MDETQRGWGWTEKDEEAFYDKLMSMNIEDMDEFEKYVYKSVLQQEDPEYKKECPGAIIGNKKSNKVGIAILDWNHGHTLL